MTYLYTTQKQLRKEFWLRHPEFQHLRRSTKRQNDYPTDIRLAFNDFIEGLMRNEIISVDLCYRATL